MNRCRFLSFSLVVATAACASPSARDQLGPPLHGVEVAGSSSAGPAPLPPSAPIVGGAPVAECGWPSVVALVSGDRLCSGTLLHPELVVTAAHCGDDFGEVRFGESLDGDGLQWTAPLDGCELMPGGGAGTADDVAYCRLGEPVGDVPIVPPLLGCEREQLEPGEPVTLVGFGFDDDGWSGRKREVVAELWGITEDGELEIGGDGADTCQGDSGGPAFVRLHDGTWRLLGITSWGGDCGDGGFYTPVPEVVPWLEEQTELDLSPCHEADGTWAPGPSCGGFPLEPGLGHGTWSLGCAAGPHSGPAASCGPAWSAEDGCEGWCGEQADAGCWCDAACLEQGDCCPDALERCEDWLLSCEGWCGEQAAAGCWCDDACVEHDDCCPDLDDACG